MSAPWTEVPIAAIAQVARGGSPRPIRNYITDDPSGVNWIKIGDTERGGRYIQSTKEKIRREGIKRSRWVDEGDFLLSNSMSFGRPYILKTSGCVHDGWLVLKPDYSRVDQGYLYYALSSPDAFRQFDGLAAGATVRNLNIDLVSGVTIPLPLLEEQKRIVAMLDQAFAALDRARAYAESNLTDVDALFESGLDRLLEKHGEFGVRTRLGNICRFENGDRGKNYPGRKAFVPEGVPFINAGHLDNGAIVWDEMNFIPEEHYRRLSKGKTKEGDLLFCLRGSLGKFGKVDRAGLGAIASSLVIVRTSNDILTDYLAMYFKSKFCREMIEKYAGGAAQPNLSAGDLKRFDIVLPDVHQQALAVKTHDLLWDSTMDLRANYERKLTEIANLRQSLLQQAFSGCLT